tara:strand:+ start:1929 stop:2570 length:642 start_codon:yes stop_codon:yes gene_type:complete
MTENMATSSDDSAGAGKDGNKYKKGLETREKILAEACQLFDSLGFANTSIRRLIRNIGKSSSVIYNHFPDKEDILFVITHGTGVRVVDLLNDLMAQTPDADACLKKMIVEMLFLMEEPRLKMEISIFNNEAHHLSEDRRKLVNEMHLQIVHLFEKAVADVYQKKGRAAVNEKIAAYNILAAINWVYVWYREDGPLTLKEISEDITRFIFHGLD